MTVAPFDFGSLEVVSRAEVARTARLRRLGRAHAKLDEVAAALDTTFASAVRAGTRSSFRVRKVRRFEARGVDDSVAVLLSLPEDATSPRRALIEVEGALGSLLVAAAIERTPPKVLDASRSAGPAASGAVAAVIVHVLRKAHASAPLRVLAAGPSHALARDFASSAGPATTAWLTLLWDDEAYDVRVSVPDAATPPPNEPDAPEASKALLLSMGHVPLSIPLVLTTCLATRAELASLGIGDVFLPPAAREALALSPSAPVSLVPPRAERGLGAQFASGGRLVIRGLEEHPWEMPESPESQTDILIEAPVVVRVELGSVEMTARAWAELAPGDVVSIGRRIGEPASLRIAGIEVARGELVQVDGEYGIRILAMSREKEST